jgi:hypothetical protein
MGELGSENYHEVLRIYTYLCQNTLNQKDKDSPTQHKWIGGNIVHNGTQHDDIQLNNTLPLC